MAYIDRKFKDSETGEIIGTVRKNLTTHNIQFSPLDEEKVKAKAAKAGLSVNAYIKKRALNAHIKGIPTIDLTPLLIHSKAVDEAVGAVRNFASQPHPSRWLYQADLERIETKLDRLISSERKLIALILDKIQDEKKG